MELTSSSKVLKPSATLAINEMIANLRSEGQQVLHLGFGEAPFPVHPRVQQAAAWVRAIEPRTAAQVAHLRAQAAGRTARISADIRKSSGLR